MEPVIWTENTPFPYVCDYHSNGCMCDSPSGLTHQDVIEGRSKEKCKYCEYDTGDECTCCECECECEDLLVDADSFNQWIKDVCYVCQPDCFDPMCFAFDNEHRICLENVGNYQFYLRNVPTHIMAPKHYFMGMPVGKMTKRRTDLPIINEDRIQRGVSFTGPVLIPILAKQDEVWMSLTPNEVFTMRDALEDLEGRVLVAGLGMGWLTNRICEKPEVIEVVQVEIDPDIIDFFGRPLLKRHPKLTIVHDDAYSFVGKTQITWDAILFDIWPGIGDASFDKRFQQLVKKYKGQNTYVWGWGNF